MNENPNSIQNVGGDGAAAVVSSEELAQLKQDVQQIAAQSGVFMQQRQNDGNVRFNIWDGQSSDGRMHAADMGKQPPLFEGQPDSQVWLTDTAATKKQAQLFLAAMRAQVTFEAAGGADGAHALKMEAVYRWILRNMGKRYADEVRRGGNYFVDGLPAGVIWFTGWNRKESLRMRTITLQEAAEFLLSEYFENPSPQDLQTMGFMLTDEGSTDALVQLLKAALPGELKDSTVRKLVKDLRELGEAEFPERYECANMPQLLAMAPWEDVFWPVNTVRDIQNARAVYMREWLTAAQVYERKIAHGWSDEFVTGLLGAPEDQSVTTGGGVAGKSGLPIPWGSIYTAQTPLNQQQGLYRDYRNLYEVITAFTQGVNEFGVPGIYISEFSMFLDDAAGERRLYTSGHGKMPFVYVQKELVNLCLTDSRGITSIGSSGQQLLKSYTDLHGATAQISTLPPMIDDVSNADEELVLSPLAVNKRRRTGAVKAIEFPRADANLEAQALVERRFRDRVGLAGEGVDPNELVALTQAEIDVFLWGLSEAWKMMLQDAQMFLHAEQIEEIIGGAEGIGVLDADEAAGEGAVAPVRDDAYDIEGQFHLEMAFDALELDSDKLLSLTNVVLKELLPADVEQTITRSKAIRWILAKWSPSLARAAAVPLETANGREIKAADEELNMMLSGVSVPMKEKGVNHALRLQRMTERLQQPNIQARVLALPDSQQLIDRQLGFYQQQTTQQRNKLIGRLGVEPDAMQQDAG